MGILLGTAAFLMMRKSRALDQAPEYNLSPRKVDVVRAKSTVFVETRSFLAVVEPVQTASVSPQVSSTIEDILVDEGDQVNEGQVMARLDSREIRSGLEAQSERISQSLSELEANRATIKALKSSAAYWEREANRDERLAREGAKPNAQAQASRDRAIETKASLQSAKHKSEALQSQVNALRKQREEMQIRLDYHKLVSPFDGVVSRRMKDSGDSAAPGNPVFHIEDRSLLRLVFDVPQAEADGLRTGAVVTFSLRQKQYKTRISRIHPSFNEARMIRAEVDLESSEFPNLVPGRFAEVKVALGEPHQAILLPPNSIIQNPSEEYYVFAVENGRLVAREIETLGTNEEGTAITGISAGTEVLKNTYLGWAQLSEGEHVEVLQ